MQALREKIRRDEIERFRASARRVASLDPEEQDVDFAHEAQAEVALAK